MVRTHLVCYLWPMGAAWTLARVNWMPLGRPQTGWDRSLFKGLCRVRFLRAKTRISNGFSSKTNTIALLVSYWWSNYYSTFFWANEGTSWNQNRSNRVITHDSLIKTDLVIIVIKCSRALKDCITVIRLCRLNIPFPSFPSFKTSLNATFLSW